MILLVACYELGHQPLSLAWPLAFLKRAGVEAAAIDLATQPFDEALARRARFVGLAVPMHTAMRLGVEAARRVRALNPQAHICFFGLYAWLNQDYVLEAVADSVIAGEFEAPLVEWISRLTQGGHPAPPAGVTIRAHRAAPALNRLRYPLPYRAPLPPLDSYARYADPRSESGLQLAGYVEATRGCLHTCAHCPIVPVYGGRFFAVPAEVVLADIGQQVAGGAAHITFGDPDFLNGPSHALRIARAMHQAFPSLTFDFTAKVEHILKHRALFPEFAALGCTFVVSAIEAVSDLVLEKLGKNHTAADIDAALSILDSAGIALQPTLVAFTPWTTLDDYVAQIEWIRQRSLTAHIPPIQLAIRLLIPPRSAILALPDTAEWIGPLDAGSFSYRWQHPDARMDLLFDQVAGVVEAAARHDEPAERTYDRIRAAAYAVAGRTAPQDSTPARRRPPPRLTEDWFCCAEPTRAQASLIHL